MISVIVPVYKVEPYLRRCVDSILAQTYSDFELILVDDGSPDTCGAICDSYAEQDARVRVIHQANGGLSAARNAGIEIARGDYLTFIDSDDLVSDYYLETLYDLICEKKADISVCMARDFSNETPYFYNKKEHEYCILSGREACLSIYQSLGILWVSAYAKLYKRELFSGIRFPVGFIHEDQATIPKLLYRANTVAISKDIVYGYRQRQGSIMHSGFDVRQFHAVEAVKNCKAYFEERHDAEMVKAITPFLETVHAEQVLKAIGAKAKKAVPDRYRMTEWKAWKTLRKNATYDKFVWFLEQIHPMWVRPYCYAEKLLQISKRG